MNLVLLEAEDFVSPQRVCLRGRRAAHVVEVHRAGVGDRLRVGVVNGRTGTGTLTRLEVGEVEIEVQLGGEPPPGLSLTLVLALPRPKVLGRVLQAATAMGVKRLLLVHAWRVEKSFWESPALRPGSIRAQLVLGLEQARDTILPEVSLHRRFRPFVEDDLPSLAAGTLALVAHPTAAEPCPRAVAPRVTLAVGPEGGFIPYEIAMLQAAGFQPITLGPRILRIEQAVPALLSRLT